MMRTMSLGLMWAGLATFAFAQIDAVQAAMEKKDFATAIKLLRPMADAGDPQAQSILAEMHAAGEGTKQNFPEALALWRKDANQNFPPAQYSLGLMYATGQGVKRDYAEAAKWIRYAADQNIAEAQKD